jgi:TRAP-type C4-dicarboxylate transport system permease small subunit
MNPEEQRAFKRMMRQTDDMYRMVRSLYRGQRIRTILRVVYFIVIIGAMVGAFYFIQPYIEQITETYTGVQGGVENAKGLLDAIPFIGNIF